ncbi:tol protein [Pyrenophora tritici-repentis]|uniref:HET domain containing protein n=2 Tax=Pyrenophora tritici-repentis TaxID=45151 RepID=A0A2W1HUZ0_9PLEO|nr:uncharacterized protein PTRG_09559 [Pyrenophora tritici-repentis Pt-1C-BFP]KAA8617725.1 Heterokaryon incompatibility [Pyrenophora tritici-repentis]EDU42610.1 conserved hypothetical protein [Pyrenophora tritici-repentis Pt-1C-BFP]KAF7443321.1 Heterokaryon incompatibility [Pyrenophora tritici-repentis]KAF7568187.1 HET domain containing protein [Pyrenophora tritici-repentis]KAI0579477.1 Heterokaryon incompatibility [Pyrenophora tritici-repentis]
MSASVQDAIWVVQTLGLEYLWIDALCIVQDDSDELTTEISKQAQIYQNGVMTILAGGAHSANEGFLRKRSLKHRRCVITIQIPGLDNVKKKFILDMSLANPHGPPTDPVRSRAWIFQEIILSLHVLYFSPAQMIFYCQEKAYFDGWGPEYGYSLDERVPGINSGIGYMNANELCRTWYRLVTEYSELKLTMPADKLPVISAVAEVFGSAISGTETGRESYKAGLWEQHFPTNLSWFTENPPPRLTRPAYRAPSWSWASIDSCVFDSLPLKDYTVPPRDYREGVPMEEVVVKSTSCNVKLASPEAPFGQVTGGYLQIEAPLTKITVSMSCFVGLTSSRSDDRISVGLRYDVDLYWLSDVKTDAHTYYLLLLVFGKGGGWPDPELDVVMEGLILSKAEDKEIYSRVGYFSSDWREPASERHDYRDYFQMSKVTII